MPTPEPAELAARRQARLVLDRAAADFGELLALNLSPAVRAGVLVALRHVAGVEALVEALAAGVVLEPGPPARSCTCAGSCRGPDGLAPGWRCAAVARPLSG